jgi:hypothetical protein
MPKNLNPFLLVVASTDTSNLFRRWRSAAAEPVEVAGVDVSKTLLCGERLSPYLQDNHMMERQ